MGFFGDSLKAIRISKGLTQSQLAEKLLTTPVAISAWENGRTEPTLAGFRQLCEVLNVPPESFLDISLKEEKIEEPEITTVIEYGIEVPFSTLLDSVCKEKQITDTEIAKRTGVTRTTVYNWKKNIGEPGLHHIKDICQLLNISACELVRARPYCEEYHTVEFLDLFYSLNTEGKREALKRISEMASLPQYKQTV